MLPELEHKSIDCVETRILPQNFPFRDSSRFIFSEFIMRVSAKWDVLCGFNKKQSN